MLRTNEEMKNLEKNEYITMLENFITKMIDEMDYVYESLSESKVTTGDKETYKKKFNDAMRKVSNGKKTKITQLTKDEKRKFFNILDRSHKSDKEQQGIAESSMFLLDEEFKGNLYKGAFDTLSKELFDLKEESKELLKEITYRSKYRQLLKENRITDPSEMSMREQVFFYKKLKK